MAKKRSFAKANKSKAKSKPAPKIKQKLAAEPKHVTAVHAETVNRWVGKPIQRREETRLVQGRGSFVDDTKLDGMLYIKMVRSPYAHAKIERVDVSQAAALPGVVCTLTGAEVAGLVKPFPEIGPGVGQQIVDRPMAVEKVRYQGEPVAAVVAISAMIAEDGAELVEVEYEPLPPVMDAETALKDESILHEEAGTNRNWHGVFEYGDVEKAFAQAAHVVNIGRMHFHRFSSTPLENNVVIAAVGFRRKIESNYWCQQFFSGFRGAVSLARARRPHRPDPHAELRHRRRLRNQDHNYPYMAVCALASRKAGGRP